MKAGKNSYFWSPFSCLFGPQVRPKNLQLRLRSGNAVPLLLACAQPLAQLLPQTPLEASDPENHKEWGCPVEQMRIITQLFDFSPLCFLKCLLKKVPCSTPPSHPLEISNPQNHKKWGCPVEQMHNYIGNIHLTFLRYVFSNVSPKKPLAQLLPLETSHPNNHQEWGGPVAINHNKAVRAAWHITNVCTCPKRSPIPQV